MPDIPWWDTTIGEQIIAWAAVLSVILVLAATGSIIVKYVHPVIKMFTTLYDKVIGRPANPRLGDPGEPGIFVQMEVDRESVKEQITEVRVFVENRLAEQDALILEIKNQVTPNNDSSEKLADQIHALNNKIQDHIISAPLERQALLDEHAETCVLINQRKLS